MGIMAWKKKMKLAIKSRFLPLYTAVWLYAQGEELIIWDTVMNMNRYFGARLGIALNGKIQIFGRLAR